MFNVYLTLLFGGGIATARSIEAILARHYY